MLFVVFISVRVSRVRGESRYASMTTMGDDRPLVRREPGNSLHENQAAHDDDEEWDI